MKFGLTTSLLTMITGLDFRFLCGGMLIAIVVV